MILLQPFFTSSNKQRQDEFNLCLRNNLECSGITKIILFVEDQKTTLPEDPKLVPVLRSERSTYCQALQYCNQFSDICCIANTDIYFNESSQLHLLENIDLVEYFICLSRWNIDVAGGIHKTRQMAQSQDAWIFRPPINFAHRVDFQFGKPGCDNRMAFIANEAGKKVINPSFDIYAYHLHNSAVRTYTLDEMVAGEMLGVIPCNLT